MINDKMIRKQVYLEPHQNDKIKRISTVKGITEAEIVREALEAYLVTEQANLHDPLTDLFGIVEVDETHGSVRHDEFIYLQRQEEDLDEKK